MKRVLSGVLASVLAVTATVAVAQSKPPLKLGRILDMSGLYADITGPGRQTAAKMAGEDFGGGGAGRKVGVIAAGHLQQAHLAPQIPPRLFRKPGPGVLF